MSADRYATFVYSPDPWHPHRDKVVARVRRRRKVSALLERYGVKPNERPTLVMVNGRALLRAGWGRRVGAGDIVTVQHLLQGGGGGSGESNPIQMVAMIALMAAAPGIGGMAVEAVGLGAFATEGAAMAFGKFVTSAVIMAGSAVINSLTKPVDPNSGANLAAPSPTYNLQAQGNAARIGQVIPVHYGRVAFYPDYAAVPYADYSGNEQYLYQLFDLGHGHFDNVVIEIEDSPLSSFGEDVSFEVVPPGMQVSLFPTNVVQAAEVSGQELLAAWVGPFTINASGTNCTGIGIDLATPKGLYWHYETYTQQMEVKVRVEARRVDSAGNAVGVWEVLTREPDVGSSSSTRYIWRAYAINYFGMSPDTGGSAVPTGWDDLGGGYGRSRAPVLEQIDRPVGVASSPQQVWHPVHNNVEWRREEVPVALVASGVRDVITISGATTTPQRLSFFFPVPAGRYQVRAMRIDEKKTGPLIGHDVNWMGVRAYLSAAHTYDKTSVLAMRMRASNNLSARASRKVRVTATRKLNVWTGTRYELKATSSIAAAIEDVCLASYGGNRPAAQIDLAGIRALGAVWDGRGDFFNGRFDGASTFWDVLTQICRVGRAEPFLQGGLIRVARDSKASIPTMLFSDRNIVAGTFQMSAMMASDSLADGVEVKYFDGVAWRQDKVLASYSGAAPKKPARFDFSRGVTNRDHAWREAMFADADNALRRLRFNFETELEGHVLSKHDCVALQSTLCKWGQSAEVVGVNGLTFTLSNDVEWTNGAKHFIGLRRRDGTFAPPIEVVRGVNAATVILAASPGFVPYTGLSEVRTHAIFGTGAESLFLKCKVVSARPRSNSRVQVQLMNDDDRVHDADKAATPTAPADWELPAVPTIPELGDLMVTVSGEPAAPVINVSWAVVGGARTVVIEYSYDQVQWLHAATVDAALTAASFAVQPGVVFVRGAAVGERARGPYTPVVSISTATLAAPAKVTGLASDSGSINEPGGTMGISWAPATRADRYQVRALGGAVARRTRTTYDTSWQYSWEDALADGGPWRSVTFQVRAGNASGWSDWVEITITNPQLGAPTGLSVQDATEQMIVTVDLPRAPDYVGTEVHVSQTAAFVPLPSTKVYDGPSTTWASGKLAAGTYRVRVGQYDRFGRDGMVYSSEVSVVVSAIPRGVVTVADARTITTATAGNPPGGDAYLVVRSLHDGQLYTWTGTGYVSVADAQRILGSIAETQLAQTLRDRIALVDGPATLAGSVAARLAAEASARGTAITNEATARADADSALSTSLQAVSAKTNSNAAAITSEVTARTNADTALGQRIDSVVATASTDRANATAAVQSEATARSTGDAALGQRIDTVVATATTDRAAALGAVTSEAAARAGADTALGQRIDSVVASVNAAAASVTTEATARASADAALGTQISQVQAIQRDGFDAAQTWHFSAGVDGWTASNAALSVVFGALRVTPSANDPMIRAALSPAISGATYPVIRARIKRVGGAGWDGTAYFTTAAHGELASFYKQIAAPTFGADGWAIVEWDMTTLSVGGTDWIASTINTIRLDLGALAADVFDVDWVAVGRRGPGAGYAAVQAEATARASADGALQSQYTLKAQVVRPDGKVVIAGIGLAATANNATATSEVIVSADRFAVVVPSAPGGALATPFAVTMINGQPVVILSKAFIGTASIDLAAINTATINNLAAVSANLGPVQAASMSIYGDGSGGWGYARTADKWLGDGKDGVAFGRHQGNGSTFFEIKAGTFKFWGTSWGDWGFTTPTMQITPAGWKLLNASGQVILDAATGIQYSGIYGTPTSLAQLDSTAASKLNGIQAGATVGATSANYTGGAGDNRLSNSSLYNDRSGFYFWSNHPGWPAPFDGNDDWCSTADSAVWCGRVSKAMAIGWGLGAFRTEPGDTLAIYQNNAVQGYAYQIGTHAQRLEVNQGDRIEFQCEIANHRAPVRVFAAYQNSSGAWVAEQTIFESAAENYTFKRVGGIFTAPTSAAYVVLVAQKGSTFPSTATNTYSNSWLFFRRPKVAAATQGQTELSPYSDGVPKGAFATVNQITPSNRKIYMADLSVDTLAIAGNAVTVTVDGSAVGPVGLTQVIDQTATAFAPWTRNLFSAVIDTDGAPGVISLFFAPLPGATISDSLASIGGTHGASGANSVGFVGIDVADSSGAGLKYGNSFVGGQWSGGTKQVGLQAVHLRLNAYKGPRTITVRLVAWRSFYGSLTINANIPRIDYVIMGVKK